MTNAEKYLKDGVSAEEFIKNIWGSEYMIADEQALSYKKCSMTAESVLKYLNKPIKPTLTEDERVILRNIDKKYNTIGRNAGGDLVVGNNGIAWSYADIFNELFQFIREEEEYEIKELLKDD